MTPGVIYAGDIKLDKAEILSRMSSLGVASGVDVRPQIMKLEIYESIFYPFTTAKLYLKDALDLLNSIPIRGEEILHIVASTPTINKKMNFAFHVFKLSEMYQDKDRVAIYTLDCISLEAFINVNRKMSRGFSGQISQLVEDLIKNDTYGLGCRKGVFIEPTSNSIKYVSNYWTPLENIKYLANRAISEKDDNQSYVFFENRDGYNFISLERLYKNISIQQFIKDNLSTTTKQSVNESYSRILSYESVNLFDYYVNSKEGVFSSTQNNYDILFKLHNQTEYISTIDSTRSTLNRNLPYSLSLVGSAKNYMFESITHSNLFQDNEGGLTINKKHLSIVNLSNYNAIKITIAGRSDYTVGYVVDVFIPKNTSLSNSYVNSPWDNTLSGRYIISEINHGIDGSGHKCTMTLIKDSLI